MFPCTEILQKVFLATMPWQKKAMNFDMPGPQRVERPNEGTLTKTALFTKSSFLKTQKRPDVHKIVLFIKLRPPPPTGKSVNFEDFLLICTVFPHFGPFSAGGGG